MIEGERTQELRERGRCPNPNEQPAHRCVPQQIGVADMVRPSHHHPDQRRDLQVRDRPSPRRQRRVRYGKLGQTGWLSKREHLESSSLMSLR